MKTATIYVTMGLMFLSFEQSAHAQQDCSKTLVMATINKTILSVQNLSIAYSVSNDEWQSLQNQYGLGATIYGIPIGASYDEFQNNVKTLATAYSMTDFQEYSEAYASSQLDPNSLEAYKFCLASQYGGLAMFVLAINDPVAAQTHGANPSYTLSIVNTPYPNQMPNVAGSVKTKQNLEQAYANRLKDLIDGADFSLGMNEQPVIYPDDPTQPALLEVQIGSAFTRTLKLPPLVIPRAATATLNYSPPITVCSGFCGGNCAGTLVHDRICYMPKNANAVFVPGSVKLVPSLSDSGASAQIEKDSSATQVCVTVAASNTSGCQNSTTASAYINAVETWAQPVTTLKPTQGAH
jgi:hypothetical protein